MSPFIVESKSASSPGVDLIPSARELAKVHVVLGDATPQKLNLREQRLSAGRPSRIKFGQLFNPALKLRRFIPVQVSGEDGSVVASWDETGEFGIGASLSAALSDLSRAIEELFFELEDEEELGTDLRRVRRVLQEYVARR